MKRIIFLSAFVFISIGEFYSQSNMRLGFNLGSTVGWPVESSGLNDGFFTVSRAGVQGGIVNTLTVSDRFIASIGANVSLQSFALRQTGNQIYNLDARFKAFQLDIPLNIGFTGYLGSLRHRETIGIGLQSNLSLSNKLVLNGDSTGNIDAKASSALRTSVYPVLMAGFEIGSTFDNDGSIYFGLHFRYGLQEVYTASFNSNVYPTQSVVYNGTYLGFGLTFYLPRYSYWFKREFIY
ncbi:MAG: hypothetical protein WED33_00555 [Bacteroidia bacterium]